MRSSRWVVERRCSRSQSRALSLAVPKLFHMISTKSEAVSDERRRCCAARAAPRFAR